MRMPTEVPDGFRGARHLSSRTCMISHRDMHIHTKTFSIFPSREKNRTRRMKSITLFVLTLFCGILCIAIVLSNSLLF